MHVGRWKAGTTVVAVSEAEEVSCTPPDFQLKDDGDNEQTHNHCATKEGVLEAVECSCPILLALENVDRLYVRARYAGALGEFPCRQVFAVTSLCYYHSQMVVSSQSLSSFSSLAC